MPGCDTCLYYEYDEEYEEYNCVMDLDEDEMERLASGHYKGCPYFRDFDEYKRVRKQN